MAVNSRFVFTSDACWLSLSTFASATFVSLAGHLGAQEPVRSSMVANGVDRRDGGR
jgi:hypothetical protein